jgi:hypothetical protein
VLDLPGPAAGLRLAPYVSVTRNEKGGRTPLDNKKRVGWFSAESLTCDTKTNFGKGKGRYSVCAVLKSICQTFVCCMPVQLYRCSLLPEVLQQLEGATSGDTVEVGRTQWRFSRSSKVAGYQFILSNADIGFVVLLKSFYVPADQVGSHLKIEVSPFVIRETSPDELSERIYQIARLFGRELSACGIAAHIAVDVKNLVVPPDFRQRFVCKAQQKREFSGISNARYSISEVAVVYGDDQTLTFGQAGALQFCLYDKITEAIKTDKIAFWESVWSCTPAVEDPFRSEYQPGDSVRRLEFRFHHSVIQEFCNGTTEMRDGAPVMLSIRSYKQLVPHLTALWRYGLTLFRLQHSSTYVDPLWQLLIEDVTVIHTSPDYLYRRAKKVPNGSSRRNVAFYLGNLARLFVRRSFTVGHFVSHVMGSGLDAELADYFGVPLYGSDSALQLAIEEYASNKFGDLILSGVAA